MNSDFTAVAKWRIESEQRLKSDIPQTSRLPGGFPRPYSTPRMITLCGHGARALWKHKRRSMFGSFFPD